MFDFSGGITSSAYLSLKTHIQTANSGLCTIPVSSSDGIFFFTMSEEQPDFNDGWNKLKSFFEPVTFLHPSHGF